MAKFLELVDGTNINMDMVKTFRVIKNGSAEELELVFIDGKELRLGIADARRALKVLGDYAVGD